jgi:hypothetical protein
VIIARASEIELDSGRNSGRCTGSCAHRGSPESIWCRGEDFQNGDSYILADFALPNHIICPRCHEGQFPDDAELDIENTQFSPGVRRMHALVGQQAPFEQGREQMKVLAGLDVTTKAVERVAEAIGEDLAGKERQEIQKAVQLDLPLVLGDPVPLLYVQMDEARRQPERQAARGSEARACAVADKSERSALQWNCRGCAKSDRLDLTRRKSHGSRPYHLAAKNPRAPECAYGLDPLERIPVPR